MVPIIDIKSCSPFILQSRILWFWSNCSCAFKESGLFLGPWKCFSYSGLSSNTWTADVFRWHVLCNSWSLQELTIFFPAGKLSVNSINILDEFLMLLPLSLCNQISLYFLFHLSIGRIHLTQMCLWIVYNVVGCTNVRTNMLGKILGWILDPVWKLFFIESYLRASKELCQTYLNVDLYTMLGLIQVGFKDHLEGWKKPIGDNQILVSW